MNDFNFPEREKFVFWNSEDNEIVVEFDPVIDRLKRKFSADQLREFAFSMSPDTETVQDFFSILENQIIEQIENLEFYKNDFINRKAEEINSYIESDIEYRKSEEYCGDYFMEIDNSQIQVNYQEKVKTESGYTYHTTKFSNDREKQISLVQQLMNKFDSIDIDSFKFNYYDMGTPFYNINEDIFFSIANLGEFEIPLSDEHKNLIDHTPEIKDELDYYIEDTNSYAYIDCSYDSIVYGISYNDFLSLIFNDYYMEVIIEEKSLILEFVDSLTDCEREEFSPELNNFIEELKK